MVLQIFFMIVQILFALCIFYLTIAFVTGAPYVPSNRNASIVMMSFANIKKGEYVYDLGSGDGRLLLMSARIGAQAVGFEINPFLVFYTYIRNMFTQERSHTKVHWKNFWNADIRNADVVFIYLIPWKMERLEQKLLHELKPGSRIISNSFVFPHIPCIRKDTANHVYMFTVPKKRI